MTTNSYGSALPTFDFPQTVAKAARSAPRRMPMAARLVPLAAAAGLAYYVGAQLSAQRDARYAETVSMMKALESAYGDRSSLQDLEAASQAYSATSATRYTATDAGR
ncbi:Uu.00g027880.m01.CDS01 [Anthostomella pinea]|uniref:Uu.00g027880.m01.CDS01 n=1 Tax=Anthostomella pinea TaxID=933095 RepID=A0AAI8YCP9_9PEZI|nr:Uu.00g027880.m01.CDS01 [Anthostomella pinea]